MTPLRTPRFEVEGRTWPHREHSRFIALGEHHIHVQVAGEGPGLLLLHGTGASTHSFAALLPLLTDRFTVVAPDLPGHGFTRVGPHLQPRLPAVAEVMAGLVEALDIDVDAVVGHSAGAAVGVELALTGRLRPRQLIGLAPALLPFPGVAGVVAPSAARLLAKRTHLIAPLVARRARRRRTISRLVASTGSRLDEEGLGRYQMLASHPGHVGGTLAMVAHWDLHDLARRLPQLSVPLLVIAGTEDRAVPLRRQRELLRRLPIGTLQVMKGLGHLLHEEAPGAVADVIVEALA